jgi:ABC-type antimicrobial peptide transport system permease subunit
MMTLDEHLQLATRTTRTAATVGVVLGVLGLLLAVVGLYGMVAYVVSRRTREFGIRMALGANPAVLQRQVLQQGLWVAATGITIGLLLAFAAGHLLRGMLLGVSAIDPLTLGASAVVIGGVTLWASYLPARQASHVDPLRALRQE